MACSKLFTIAGITTHSGSDAKGNVSSRTKVRFGTDMIRLVKMLNNPKKIEDKRLGICLTPERVELVELPNEMTKEDAIRYIATLDVFKSAADQEVIQEALNARAPKTSKAVKMPVSMDAIKARAKATKTEDAELA